MREAWNKLLECHRYGFRALKVIGNMDGSLLFFSALQAVLNGIFPYIELYLAAFMVDALLGKRYSVVPMLTVILVTANLTVGLVIDLLDKVTAYKADGIQRQMVQAVDRKAMELDYEEMENSGLLQKISDANYIMEHIGGYQVFLSCYRQLAENFWKIAASFLMILELGMIPGKRGGSWLLTISSVPVSLAWILALTAANILSGRYISGISRTRTSEGYHKKMKVERTMNYYVSEVFLNDAMGKEIRIFDMVKLIFQHYGNALRESIHFYDKYYFDVDRRKEIFRSIGQGIYTLGAYGIVMIKVLADAITIGGLSRYTGAIVLLNQAVFDLIDTNQKICLQTEFIRIFEKFMSYDTPEKGKETLQIQIKKTFEGIEFHHVSFRYKNSEAYTLKDISCKITPGSKIAVVGKNGAGKTTFVKLLCRLYEPTEGYITLNGRDIREYDSDEYRSLLSVVFQDFQLFSFPIAENVAVSRTPDQNRVWESLEEVGLAEKIHSFPKQVETNLYHYDTDGINISGGEAQKTVIARALYKDAPLVILDEPTAALDPISEYEIFAQFQRMVKGKTSIFISHRMGSCKICDEIFVFDQGKIVQHGTHEELLSKQGIYAALYQAQSAYYLS